MSRKQYLLSALIWLMLLALPACGGTAVTETITEPTAAIEPTAVLVEATAVPATATLAPTPTEAPPTAAPTETPLPPTATATAAPEPAFRTVPAVDCCRGRTLSAGRYALPSWLGIPLTVDVAEGWKVLNEEQALLFALGRGQNVQNNPSELLVFMNATQATPTANPERVIAGLQGSPELSALGEPASVTMAGFSGWQVDSVALPNPDYQGDPSADIPPGVQFLPAIEQYFAPGFAWTTSSPEALIRTIALQVGDQTLVICVEAPPDTFEAFADDVTAVLQTLAINPAPET